MFDVLVGVNLLREGLDLPEVSLVAILDADKEGFLRSDRALIQTIGRAARNVHSKAILYGDTVTGSMQRAIDITNRHREKQIRYNIEHHIVPRQIVKSTEAILGTTSVIERAAEESDRPMPVAAEPAAPFGKNNSNLRPPTSDLQPPTSNLQPSTSDLLKLTKEQLRKEIRDRQRKMQTAAKELDFMAAAKYRDEIKEMQSLLETAR